MGLPITINYTFATATSSIPLSNLDANFSTLSTAVNSLGNGAYSFSAISSSGDASFTGTGQVSLPSGTTAQRSSTPVNGMIRYNSDTSKIESYQGGTWVNFFTATGNAVTVSSGGTGLTTLTANNLLVGNGTGNITFIAPGSSGNVIQSNGTTLSSVAKIASGNAVTTTSGSSVDFTSIPSYAKRITMILSGVSLTGTDNLWARIGSGSFTTSGYTSQAIKANGSTGTATAGFYVAVGTGNISTYYGQATFYNITGNTWVFTSVIADIGNTSGNYSSGSIALSGTLDRIQLLPSGSNTFDAGIVNVFWE